MISTYNSGLLNDTLNIVQLARQAALARGKQDQAEKLSSVVNGLHQALETTQDVKEQASNSPKPTLAPVSDLLAQDDFRTLLGAVQRESPSKVVTGTSQASQVQGNPQRSERNQIAIAMASGGMAELDVARQLGMTRDEVHILVSLNRSNTQLK